LTPQAINGASSETETTVLVLIYQATREICIHLRTTRGIAATVFVLVIIVIAAVAGAGAYLVLSSGHSSSSTTTTTTQATTSGSSTTHATTTTSTIPPTTTTTTTTSSPSTTATSTSSQSTQTSFTCTTTSATATTTTGPVDYTPQYIGLIKEFSSIEFNINGTESGTAVNETFGYTTSAVSSGIYNVSISTSVAVGSFSFVVNTNNDTVLSANIEGTAIPKSEAKAEFDAFMGLFGLEAYYSGNIAVFTAPAYFTKEGTTTKTYGTVSFSVTSYGLKSANEVIDECGVSSTISSYTLSVGTPPGTSLVFITYLQFSGTSGGTSEDITFQLVSMTLQG
jgi:hypothetical protein